jgi:hypothetical protein
LDQLDQVVVLRGLPDFKVFKGLKVFKDSKELEFRAFKVFRDL